MIRLIILLFTTGQFSSVSLSFDLITEQFLSFIFSKGRYVLSFCFSTWTLKSRESLRLIDLIPEFQNSIRWLRMETTFRYSACYTVVVVYIGAETTSPLDVVASVCQQRVVIVIGSCLNIAEDISLLSIHLLTSGGISSRTGDT